MTQQSIPQDTIDRINALARPENFQVFIETGDVYDGLSGAEAERLDRKLIMVSKLAAKLAANMVKGTIKYPTDTWSLEQWFEFGLDDAVDTVNYIMLAREAYREMQNEV